ncbi:hypothetical protein [Shewanella algae]|uniref:hypothetical protein n=1 Tax=Shewanella algae TaxID=38313 RepID=UPI003004955F
MRRNYNCIEGNYKRHIIKVREFARRTDGYERALKILEYFKSAGHPHPDYTFKQIRCNSGSYSDKNFPINLMKEMAYLVATNEYLNSSSIKET